jgi:octaprenyl-diphosphate synthase
VLRKLNRGFESHPLRQRLAGCPVREGLATFTRKFLLPFSGDLWEHQSLERCSRRGAVTGSSELESIQNISVREIFDLVRADLLKVEDELSRQSVSSVQPITEIGQYLHVSGGKRLRPALLLLASKLCGYEGPPAIRLGAVVELIHTATLVHDDVIDEADKRRGRPSTNSRWGNSMSVLAGDWLYMQAFNIALAERNFRILDILIGLTQSMVEGELLQLTFLRRTDIREDDYLELAYRKTACLFSACMRLGALLGGVSEEAELRLGSYGANLGLAFQIIDDLLDLTSSEEKLGKPTGSDLREGKLTLPLIYLLRQSDGEESARVARLVADGSLRPEQLLEIVALMQRCGALQRARDKAYQFASLSRKCLDTFPDSPYREALRALVDFVVERES